MADTDPQPVHPADVDTEAWELPSEEAAPAPWVPAAVEPEPAPEVIENPKVPEPALVRAFLVAAAGLVGAVIGKQLDLTWIDPAITVYAISAPFVLGFWIRRHVSPAPKT